ncbi:hypothetical protein [Variovorax sp. E3]|uniref:hypothetical protein n=1 Tax=Variovorax sp. E3 TaxID=1914993 RepID=UPI0018DC6242|nr:hypothetical protein [Variovorax sp. E3]
MKLNLSRREFHLTAAHMLLASSAGGALLGSAGPAFAQSRSVKLGTFGAIDAQNYIRAKNLTPRTFGQGVSSDFVTVRAGSEVISAMAGGSLDMCNIGSSPMMVATPTGSRPRWCTSTRTSWTANAWWCRATRASRAWPA